MSATTLPAGWLHREHLGYAIRTADGTTIEHLGPHEWLLTPPNGESRKLEAVSNLIEVIAYVDEALPLAPIQPLGVGDRFYHRRADLYGRIEGWAPGHRMPGHDGTSMALVQYELPYDGPQREVPLAELERPQAGGAA